MEVSLKSLWDRLKLCETEIDFYGVIPHTLEICGKDFSPGDLRLPLLKIFKQISRGKIVDELITICPGQINPDISSQPPFSDKTWTRDIYPKAFTGENICTMVANQTWTFKPVKIKN